MRFFRKLVSEVILCALVLVNSAYAQHASSVTFYNVNLGVAGNYAGAVIFNNGSSGSITLAPPSGALGTVTDTLPLGGTLLSSTSSIPYSQLPALSANQVLGALTANTPTGQSVPSCSATSDALIWTSGTGFGCVTGYAPLASPNFTGTPVAPTAAVGTNNTQIATTAYVENALAEPPAIASLTFSNYVDANPYTPGHIQLFSGIGLGITAGQFNFIVASGLSYDFYNGSTDVANISNTGLNSTAIGVTSPSTGSFTSLIASSFIKFPQYTVSTLPTCNTSTQGEMASVTDATSPTYNGTLTGGGSVDVPVFCNGSAWVSN